MLDRSVSSSWRPFCSRDAILAGLWGGKNYQNMPAAFKVKKALYSVHPSTNKYLDQAEINFINRSESEPQGRIQDFGQRGTIISLEFFLPNH